MKSASPHAVFPGSFDPLTNGHVDIINRSLKIFGRLTVALLRNPDKRCLFTIDERIEQIRREFASSKGRVQVDSFSGLLVDYAKKIDATAIIRGLRAISDYDYEAQMALMNRNLSTKVETVFLISTEENSYISSSIVKQVAILGGDVSRFVPKNIQRALLKKIKASK